MQRKTGARGLRTILENVLLETMYELPSLRNVAEGRRRRDGDHGREQAVRASTTSDDARLAAVEERRADGQRSSLSKSCTASTKQGAHAAPFLFLRHERDPDSHANRRKPQQTPCLRTLAAYALASGIFAAALHSRSLA